MQSFRLFKCVGAFTSFFIIIALTQVACASPAKPKTFVYKEVDGVAIKANVYVPEGDGKRPVIFWIHGGALMLGSRGNVPPQILQLARDENYALVSIDYRLAPETLLEEIIKDLKDAIDWVREKGPDLFHANPNRMVVAGASAGGYLSLMSGISEPPLPTAIVSYWGFGDITADWTTKPNPSFGKGDAPTLEEAMAEIDGKMITHTTKENSGQRGKLFFYMKRYGKWTELVSGWDPLKEPEKLKPYCPIKNVNRNFPPLLLLHGTADKDVDVGQSREMKEALEAVGLKPELVTVEGGGHGLWGGDKKKIEAAFQRSIDFMRERLNAK